jgi:hypothetical protein
LTYDDLLATCEGVVKIKETDFSKCIFLKGVKGLYVDGNVAINSNIKLDNEKTCVLIEELGHYYTSIGNILDKSDISKAKQEKRARDWGYEKLVGIIDIIKAFNAGVETRYEMAEYLNITEDFLDASIKHYEEKYGAFYLIDKYLINFKPYLEIIKKEK